MSKLSKSRARAKKRYAKPSAPRVIGANDNIDVANDNKAPVFDLSREPGVKETPNQRIFRQMMRRMLDERSARPAQYDPARLTPAQVKDLQRAEDQLRSRDPRRQEAGRKKVEELAKSVHARIAANDHADAQSQIRTLEGLRGSTVVEGGRNEPPGRLKITSRDGLETLLTSGSIDRTQHAAGMLYRTDYERIDPEKLLTPPQLDPAKVKMAHGGDNWDTKRREIEERVFRIHLMICGVEVNPGERGALPALPKGHPAKRAIHALEEVAGKGANIRDMASGGRTRERIKDDLLFALDACAIIYGLD